MHKSLFSGLLPCVLAIAACSADPADLAGDAKAAFAAHDFGTARLKLAAAIAANPADTDLRLMQVRTLLALGDGDGAATAIAAIAGDRPKDELARLASEAALLRKSPKVALSLLEADKSPEAERLRGLAALQTGDIPAAGRHFAAAAKDGRNVRALTDFARYKLMSGDTEAAVALVGEAAKVDPGSIDVLLMQGQLAVRRGDLATARATYERAEKAYPSSLAALTGLAAVLGDLGRLNEMKRPLDRAAARAPNDATVIFLRARKALLERNFAEARALVEPLAPKLAVGDPLRLIYGEALLRLGQNEQAIATVGPPARARIPNRRAVALLAQAQLAAGDARAAAVTLRPIGALPAPSPEELDLLLKVAEAAGDEELAALGKRLRAPAVQALAAELSNADTAMKRGNWAAASDAYRRVLAMTDGRNVLVLNNLAYAQLMLGNHDEAHDFATRALKLEPDNPSVLDTAGWARFKSGDNPDEARAMLRKAAAKAPDNPVIRRHLAQAEGRPDQ